MILENSDYKTTQNTKLESLLTANHFGLEFISKRPIEIGSLVFMDIFIDGLRAKEYEIKKQVNLTFQNKIVLNTISIKGLIIACKNIRTNRREYSKYKITLVYDNINEDNSKVLSALMNPFLNKKNKNIIKHNGLN